MGIDGKVGGLIAQQPDGGKVGFCNGREDSAGWTCVPGWGMKLTGATGDGGGFTAVHRGPEARDAASSRGTKDAWTVGSAASPLTFRLPVRVLMRSLDCTALTMLSAWASVVGSAAAVCTTACAAVTFCTAQQLLSLMQ